ncbi:hypothetical protein [Vibrio sp. M260118]|uniref:hypothetical protein n=1 Tax=Vibrio sp. M260118 TaxID=3020896 RepID=UPI002F41CBC5
MLQKYHTFAKLDLLRLALGVVTFVAIAASMRRNGATHIPPTLLTSSDLDSNSYKGHQVKTLV